MKALREVLLCGGAYNSPQLLMLSGIGDPSELAGVGIGLVHSLPAVGKGLANHLQLYVPFEARRPECAMGVGAWGEGVGDGDNISPDSKQMVEKMKQQWRDSRTGPGCLPDFRARFCIRTDPKSSDPNPNMQAFALPSQLVSGADGMRSVEPAFTIVFNNLRPKSVGHVGLRTASAADAPLVRQNHLDVDCPDDLRELIEGVKFARHMFAQPALSQLVGAELKPGVHMSSDAALEVFVREVFRYFGILLFVHDSILDFSFKLKPFICKKSNSTVYLKQGFNSYPNETLNI